jgi:predicted MFS family arabinose efflux permease
MLTGFGYSLVYPGLGVEAVRRAPPQSRGLAMGAYTALLDVALGFGSPALGLMASWAGLGSVFLAGALIVLCAAAIAVRLLAVRGTLITKASFTNVETAAASSWRARRIKGATLANFSG